MKSAPPWIGEQPPPLSKRPRCGFCGEPLRPLITLKHSTKQVERTGYIRQEVEPGVFRMIACGTGKFDSVPGGVIGREWSGQYDSYGAFCTLRCACDFGNAAFSAGYRIKRGFV